MELAKYSASNTIAVSDGFSLKQKIVYDTRGLRIGIEYPGELYVLKDPYVVLPKVFIVPYVCDEPPL